MERSPSGVESQHGPPGTDQPQSTLRGPTTIQPGITTLPPPSVVKPLQAVGDPPSRPPFRSKFCPHAADVAAAIAAILNAIRIIVGSSRKNSVCREAGTSRRAGATRKAAANASGVQISSKHRATVMFSPPRRLGSTAPANRIHCASLYFRQSPLTATPAAAHRRARRPFPVRLRLRGRAASASSRGPWLGRGARPDERSRRAGRVRARRPRR